MRSKSRYTADYLDASPVWPYNRVCGRRMLLSVTLTFQFVFPIGLLSSTSKPDSLGLPQLVVEYDDNKQDQYMPAA